MTNEQKSKTLAKIYVLNLTSESYFRTISGYTAHKTKSIINHALNAVTKANKHVEAMFKSPLAVATSEEDSAVLYGFLELATSAAEQDRFNELVDDLNVLVEKYKAEPTKED